MKWRMIDKEIRKNRFLRSIPGIICERQPERLRNSHTSCCLSMKHPPEGGGGDQFMTVNKPFSYQEIQRIKEDLGGYLEDPEKSIRIFKAVT